MTQIYWGSADVARALGIKSRTTALKIMNRSGMATNFGIPNGAVHVPVEPFKRWLCCQTVKHTEKKPPAPPRKKAMLEGLTEDGLIPYRRKKKGA